MSKRTIARRGSTSAPDPFNINYQVNLDPNRSSNSKLTILKLPHNLISERTQNRLSFAFSSFSNHTHSTPTLPSDSSLRRGRPKLTPDQIVDLARQATLPIHSSTSQVFTPLPHDVYLPFIDRPSEVAAIISSPPDLKLFALLAQTFSLPSKAPPPLQSTELPRDPAAWTYHHLIHHLTKIDRDLAPDFLWSIAARKCILSHSELIWERVKAAFGIPPELDLDYDFLEDDQASPDPSEDGDLFGERDDKWEHTFLDSPVFIKTPTGLPPVSQDFTSPAEDHISIEPLLTSSEATSPHPPPSSSTAGALGEGLGLDDIAEGAEEEEEEEEVDPTKNEPKKDTLDSSSDPFNSILPSQIQGLRISTAPSSTLATTAPAPLSFESSAPPTAHSRTSSISSLLGPFNRSESTGALSSLWSASAQAGVFFSGSDAGDSYDDKDGGDRDKMQGMGMGPMFPGNFARLGSGLRRSSSSSSSARGKLARLPHARYVASAGVGIPSPPVEEVASPKDKVRAFSHAGGQRPFVQPTQRRRSWGAGMNSQKSGA